MKLSSVCGTIVSLANLVSAAILQNGQVRVTDYPNTVIDPSQYQFKSYPPTSSELSYKGRWDSKYISWWSAPGLKFGFTGEEVAITFGPLTTDTTLIGYLPKDEIRLIRHADSAILTGIDGQDWQFTNVTVNATHLLVSQSTPAVNLTNPISPSTFELRVTNWAYGVQIASVHVSKGSKLVKIPDFSRTVEVIGDSLSAGQYATLEGLASYSYGMAAGLGDTEYSITAYPGICLFDKRCYGNLRGMFYQWFRTSDTSGRAFDIWGDNPEVWDFSKRPAADIVVINIGTNDYNSANNVTTDGYVAQYTMLIEGVHTVWPKAQIILISLWEGFGAVGNTYEQSAGFLPQIYSIYEYFNSQEYLSNNILYDPVRNKTYQSHRSSTPFVSYFNTTGLMQHNDIAPQYHPTDVGHIKIASHLIQYIKLKFNWVLYATGPEVQHDTLYWNDMPNY